MASLIPGYEYDIFISYRHKDNKYDGWVTEFVDNLKRELEATFKEEISVYFDINPHDGLLETHDVDASLREKLKCLVFIPIISRTYCDPKSFAWEHEFKAFVEQASQDQFGLKVKLTNGNVAGRVLPIRIHELDNADTRLCEDILGGILRGIEFNYEEPGVNRPLTQGDDENKNLKKTRYRNQINKTALAINEIMQGLMTEPEWQKLEKKIGEETNTPVTGNSGDTGTKKSVNHRKVHSRALYTISFIAVIITALIIFFPWTIRPRTWFTAKTTGDKVSVTVLPFQNMTNDPALDYLQTCIQYNLISILSESAELVIRTAGNTNDYLRNNKISDLSTLTSSASRTISRNLDADILIHGTIIRSGTFMRINLQLIDAANDQVIRPFVIDMPSRENISFQIFDSLALGIMNYFELSSMIKDPYNIFNQSQERNINATAFRVFLEGQKAFTRYDFSTAIEKFKEALASDSSFINSYIAIIWSLFNQKNYTEAKIWFKKAEKKSDQMSRLERIDFGLTGKVLFGNPSEGIPFLNQRLSIDDQDIEAHSDLGYRYFDLCEYEKAIYEFEKVLDIYRKRGGKPYWSWPYAALGRSYHKTGNYKKEYRIYKKAEREFPNDINLVFCQAIYHLSRNDTARANNYIERYKSLLMEDSEASPEILIKTADLYFEASYPDKAEELYLKAFTQDSENSETVNKLAYFLICTERDIIKGTKLAEDILQKDPDNFDYLHTKGWGLYKLGKYKEALEVLQKSWDIRREKAIYNHEAFIHLEEAKKAVAITQ